MICFQLKCYNDHVFDSWFLDSQSYDQQQKMNLVACPQCGICDVSKAITAPNIIVKGRSEKTAKEPDALVDPSLKAKEAVRNITNFITNNFEDVGSKFAEEARNIHLGNSEPRNIYGKSSNQEAQELIDDGIDVFVLPCASTPDA